MRSARDWYHLLNQAGDPPSLDAKRVARRVIATFQSMDEILKEIGVPEERIKNDFFPAVSGRKVSAIFAFSACERRDRSRC